MSKANGIRLPARGQTTTQVINGEIWIEQDDSDGNGSIVCLSSGDARFVAKSLMTLADAIEDGDHE